MKTQLNDAIKLVHGSAKIDEIFLFKEMAKELNKHYGCTYVKSVHQCYVKFPSKYKKSGIAQVELGDLLFLVFDKATKQFRISIMQVKYRPKRYYRFLTFISNVFQWELLKDKVNITNVGHSSFPKNLLNFTTDYESITSYGIFYKDNSGGDIDFLYTLPKYIRPLTKISKPLSRGNKTFNFVCPANMGSPNPLCTLGIKANETVSTCSIDVFEKQLLSFHIGALVIKEYPIYEWIISLLHFVKNNTEDSKTINDILRLIPNNYRNDVYYFDRYPSLLVLITDTQLEKQNSEQHLKNDELSNNKENHGYE